MADNVTLPGTGGTVASDEIGGIQHQRVKVQWGADGSANDTSAADPLPVSLPVDGDGANASVKIMGSNGDPVGTNADGALSVSVVNGVGSELPVTLPVDVDGALGKIKLMGKLIDDNTNHDIGAYPTDLGYAVPVIVVNTGITDVPVSWGANASVITIDYTSYIYDGPDQCIPKFAAISCAGSGNNTLKTAVADKKIRVLAISLTASAAVNAKFQSGAGGTDLTGLYYMGANGGFVLPYNKLGWFETGTNALLNLNLSGAVPVGGCLTYIEVT